MTTVLESLNRALQDAFAADENVYMLGEDILDPYGGAFKVARGLASAYPRRVLTTPVSEAGMVGLATGMALRGLRPVVEIMFGDFITLAADQLINHAAKFCQVYGNGLCLPLLVRTPMGGRRGYGPTHSQTLEKLFIGVPGLQVLAPSALGDPGALLRTAILEGTGPTLFVENKLLYIEEVLPCGISSEFTIEDKTPAGAPVYRVRINGAPAPQLTLAAYGYMAGLAVQAVRRLAYEEEIFAEVVAPTRLSPADQSQIIQSAAETGRLLVIEEGTRTLGWGAEVAATVTEALGPRLKMLRRLAARDEPVPASPVLEEEILPGVEQIIQLVRLMV